MIETEKTLSEMVVEFVAHSNPYAQSKHAGDYFVKDLLAIVRVASHWGFATVGSPDALADKLALSLRESALYTDPSPSSN